MAFGQPRRKFDQRESRLLKDYKLYGVGYIWYPISNMPNEIKITPIDELAKTPTETISKEMLKAATQPLVPVSTIAPDEEGEIKYVPFEQDVGLCGPASLKILLSHFDKNYSEADLAKLTDANKDYGAEHDGLIKGVKALGGHVFEKENGTIE